MKNRGRVFILAMFAIALAACNCGKTVRNMNVEEAFQRPQDQQLASAAACGDADGIEAAIAAGADVNASGKNELSPLIWAIVAGNAEGVSELLDVGANPDLPPYAIFFAVELDRRSSLEALLKHGANTDIYDKGIDATPLHLAVRQLNRPLIELLVKYGADLNVVDSRGYTPMDQAAIFNRFDYVLYFLNHGADYREEFISNSDNALVFFLETSIVNPSSHLYKARQEVVDFLRAKGLKINLKHP